MAELHHKLGLRPVINVSGTMTGLGASIALPQVAQAMAEILPQFVEMGDLQRKASAVIARLTGAEAGFVTASCSAGITLSVAGCMSGDDLAVIERLPHFDGIKNEVIVQMGHVVSYGAPVDQAIRLAGATPVLIGQATSCYEHHLRGAISERTAAALYVVSHHVVEYGLLPLKRFAEICHAKDIPVIVDAASEYDLRGFLERFPKSGNRFSDKKRGETQELESFVEPSETKTTLVAGADIVLYSGHKFLSGPTSGIVAGKKQLVRNAYLQNIGIGRGMKVGKESVYGVMAALEAWEHRDHAGIAAREYSYLELWQETLKPFSGITAQILPDPTGNPLKRLRVNVDAAAAHITAWDLADALAAGDPPVIVRDHEVEHAFFTLDPCNLHEGQEHIVAKRLVQELEKARSANEIIATPLADRPKRAFDALRRWPD